MFQLFQTRDRPVVFIVTLVYTCRAFFAVSSENNCPIYSFVHSLSQSVSQWNYFSPLKYIVYKCFSCFKPGVGHFFSLSRLSTLVALFLLYHQKIIVPYIHLCSLSQSISQWNSFSPLKYTVYKCFSCFRPGMCRFVFHRHTRLHLSRCFCCFIRK